MRRSDREVTKIEDIEAIISRADVCRVAFASDNIPYIVTLNFGYSGGKNPCLWFHCAPSGRKLEMASRNNYVCFELDTDHRIYSGEKGCDWGMEFSSVVGYGRISVIDDDSARKTGLDCIMKKYTGCDSFSYDPKVLAKTTILRLDIEEMTGKRK